MNNPRLIPSLPELFLSALSHHGTLVLLTVLSLVFVVQIRAQIPATESVTVNAQEIPSAYGAPPAFSQSRFAPLTNAYVLPPGEVFTSVIFEGDAVHYRSPDYHWTEECEVGLPYRINLAVETDVQRYDGNLQDSTFSLEGRYAFADWNKIPLNPTFFTEYKFGIGDILHDEGAPTPAHKFGPGGFDNSQPIPDAYELRLLLSQDFFDRIEWAMNTFFEQEVGGDRGREWGIANSFLTPIRLGCPAPTPAPISDGKDFDSKNVKPVAGATTYNEDLKVGLECQFRSFSDKGSRGSPYNSFVIGPTASWRATHGLRFDVSPLFGVNHKSPIAQVFVVVSYLFGPGGPEAGGEAPASTRNR
jgi:hypothetical protein